MAGTDKPYVVGIDESTAALHAARWAAYHAGYDHAPLRLVHAYRDGWAAEACAERLRTVRDAVLDVRPDLLVDLWARKGDPAQVLLDSSAIAWMLVLGTHRMHGHGGLLPGSPSVRIAGAANCPVVIARGRRDDEPPPLAGSIVVGVDGARHSETALAFALHEASECGAPVIALHAWQPGDALSEEQAQRHVADWLAPWLDKFSDVPVTQRVVCDQVLRALLHFASSARLLVIGNRGPDAHQSLVLGGTGQYLIHHAAGPIAIVRAGIPT